MVEAKWSGAYPCLCFGEWTLIVNGENVSDKIPSDLRKSPMDTYGIYSSWHFNDDYLEEFDDYDDGLDCEEWIERNDNWLKDITTDYSVKEQIFTAIQEEDFRTGSCGGCI